jgi:hypothetical protein
MSSDWAFEKKDNILSESLDRPTSKFKNKPNVSSFIKIKAETFQELEDSLYTVLTERWLDDAVGEQLNQLGQIVGEPRIGRNDEDYRVAITTRITLNSSGGEPERVIQFLQSIAVTDDVSLEELFPAKIKVFVGAPLTLNQARRLRQIVAAGIGTIFVETSDGQTPFGTSELGSPDPVNVLGFGELGFLDFEFNDEDLLELNDGNTLGVTDANDFVAPESGGAIAELFEV